MIVIISPAKNINFENSSQTIDTSDIRFSSKSKQLLTGLKKLSNNDLASLMKISSKLSQLNFERYQNMEFPLTKEKTKAALLVFNGAVFQNMQLDTFSVEDLHYSQSKLRILSGFYGLLRPLDGIMPYRLEMGTPFRINNSKNLYEFWGDEITDLLQQDLNNDGDKVLINLASNEYFKSINKKNLDARIIQIEFKEYKEGKYKTIAIYAKMARGMMTAYILKNKISNPDEIKLFDESGYQYSDNFSEKDKWVFIRG